MKGKRGRPATGRKPLGHNGSYYIPDPANFQRHLNKLKLESLIKAFNTIHINAFDRELTRGEKENLKPVIKAGIIGL